MAQAGSEQPKDIVAPEGEQRPRGRRIGVAAGTAEANEIDQRSQEIDPQLYVFVGGKGLAALQTMATAMERNGVKFGDDIAVNGGRKKLPMAFYVDADLTETDAARGSEASRAEAERMKKEKEELLRDLKAMGVEIFDLARKQRAQLLVQMGLEPQLTHGLPTEENAEGAQADPRIGLTKWVVNRERNDERNVANAAYQRALALQEGGKAFLGPEFWVTFVGSLDGGTGPTALPILVDVRKKLEEALSSSETKLRTARFAITSESAGIDTERAHDGKQRKRDLNTAAQLIAANAADVQGGFEMKPGEWIPGLPSEFTFVVGGRNGAGRTVSTKGGHYETAHEVGKLLLAKVFGIDYAKTGRAQAGFDRVQEATGVNAPNTPRAVFSAFGLSEFVPAPDRAELTAAKRKDLLERVAGLADIAAEEALDRDSEVAKMFPPDHLQRLLDAVSAPALNSARFGEGAEKKDNAEGVHNEFIRGLTAQFQAKIDKGLVLLKDDMAARLRSTTIELRAKYGLQTALSYLTAVQNAIAGLDQEAKRKLDVDCSQNLRNELQLQGQELLEKVISTIIPPLFQGGALKRLGRRVDDLVKNDNAYARVMRDYNYLRNLLTETLNPLRDSITALRGALAEELATARALHGAIEPDPREKTTVTVFDVPVPVELEIHDDPALMRAESLGKGKWTRARFEAMLRGIHVTAEDIDLLASLTEQRVEAAGKLSKTFMRPATAAGDELFMTSTYAFGVPVSETSQLNGVSGPAHCTKVKTGTKGPAVVVREEYGINSLLDDAYVFECLLKLLATPPTYQQARELADVKPTDPNARALLSREGQFPWIGQADRLLPPVYAAIAKRQMVLAGGKGEIVENCPGTSCSLPFYKSESEVREKISHCPGCREISRFTRKT